MECEISPKPFAEAVEEPPPAEGARVAAAFGVYADGRLGEGGARLDERTGGALRRALAVLPAPGPGAARMLPPGTLGRRLSLGLFAVGLGERTELTPEGIRRAAAGLARAVRATDATLLHAELVGGEAGLPPSLCAQALVEGFGLAWDAAGREAGERRAGLRLVLHGPAAALVPGVRRGQTLLAAQIRARDLAAAAGPSGADLARFFRQAEEALRPAAFALAGAGPAGGPAEPGPEVLAFAARRPAPDPREARGTLLLVGRGLAGRDEAGLAAPAAAVAAARAIVELRLPFALEVFLCVERLARGAAPELARPPERDGPGPSSAADQRATPKAGPGEREAEGDAVSRFVSARADMPGARLLHVASDRAGAAAALGREMAVMMAGDREMGEALQAGAAAAGEPCWPLPADPAYLAADPEGGAAALRAGLRAWLAAGRLPWCHLDVSAACRQTGPYHPAGAGRTNGFGARTLALSAEALGRPGPAGPA